MRLSSTVFLATLLTVGASAQLPLATTGDVLVSSSSSNKLLRLAFDGKQLAEFSYSKLSHPRGIVVGKGGTVFLVSQNTNEVLVLDRTLKLLSRFTTKNVKGPTGAALGPNGNLFVAGYSSSNVGEYKTDGTYVTTYSATDLSGSNCVTFRTDGGFYVSSAANGKVVQFDSKGKFVRSFTGYKLSSPMGMAIWKNELFVTGGGSSNVVVFDLNGKALREIKHKGINGPQGIAFSTDGTFVTSSFYAHTVSWYDAKGTHVRTVTPKSSKVPRSLAFLPGATLTAANPAALGKAFSMKIESAFEPGLGYVTAFSLSTSPGIKLPDTRLVPLTNDQLMSISSQFPGFIGGLDAKGVASPGLFIPYIPALRGVTIYAAAVTIDSRIATYVRQITTATGWKL